MKLHELKTYPEFFSVILEGKKPWEIRYNDRDYQPGDYLHLKEYDPRTKEFTGRAKLVAVAYVFSESSETPYNTDGLTPGFGLLANYVIMTIVPVSMLMREAGAREGIPSFFLIPIVMKGIEQALGGDVEKAGKEELGKVMQIISEELKASKKNGNW